MTLPVSWKKQKVQCEDSNCGTYKGRTADLEFDEVLHLGYTTEKAQSLIDDLKKKEADPKLLKADEEIWRVDGRIAYFWAGKVDPKKYGKRRFSNVADLHVPYPGEPGYLSIFILYRSDKDLARLDAFCEASNGRRVQPRKIRNQNERLPLPKEVHHSFSCRVGSADSRRSRWRKS